MPGPGFQCPLSKQGFLHLAVPTRSNTGDLGSVPGLGRSPEKGKSTYSIILAWRLAWTVQSTRSQ